MADTTYNWVGGPDGDWGDTASWTPNTGYPGDADHAQFPAGVSKPVLDGLDQDGTVLATLLTDRDCITPIGYAGNPLIIDADLVKHLGDASLYYQSGGDEGNYTTHLVVDSPNDTLAAWLSGARIQRVSAINGSVVLDANLGSTTCVNILEVGGESSGAAGPKVVVPARASDPTSTMITSAHQTGGLVTSTGVVQDLRQFGGLWIQDVHKAYSVYLAGGELRYQAESGPGTLTNAYVYHGGILNLASTPGRKTVTNCWLFPGGTVIYNRNTEPFGAGHAGLVDLGGNLKAV